MNVVRRAAGDMKLAAGVPDDAGCVLAESCHLVLAEQGPVTFRCIDDVIVYAIV